MLQNTWFFKEHKIIEFVTKIYKFTWENSFFF